MYYVCTMAKGIKGSGPSKEQKPQRTSLSITPEKTKKLKYVAIIEGSNFTELVNEGLQYVIDRFEKKNGPIPIK